MPAPGRPGPGPRRSARGSSAVRATAWSGVTSNALATALRASRREKVDPSRVRGIARTPGSPDSDRCCSSICQSSSETPAFPVQDPEHLLDVCRAVGRPSAVTARGRRSGRRPLPAGCRLRRRGARWRRAAPASPHGGRRVEQPPSGLRARVVERGRLGRLWDEVPPFLHGLLDVGPALREGPEDRLGDVSKFAQSVAAEIPGEPEGCQLGPQCGPVEGAGGLLPR